MNVLLFIHIQFVYNPAQTKENQSNDLAKQRMIHKFVTTKQSTRISQSQP